ncbi:MAG: hypothetical protein ACRDY2_10540 [Acidimicrobiales bacterium]
MVVSAGRVAGVEVVGWLGAAVVVVALGALVVVVVAANTARLAVATVVEEAPVVPVLAGGLEGAVLT